MSIRKFRGFAKHVRFIHIFGNLAEVKEAMITGKDYYG